MLAGLQLLFSLSGRRGGQRGEDGEEMPPGHLQTYRRRVSQAGIQPVSANASRAFLFLSFWLAGHSSERVRGSLESWLCFGEAP